MKDRYDPTRYKLVDTETGEFLEMHFLADKVRKAGWEKAYAKLLCEYIGCAGSSTTKVLAYLIEQRNADNLIIGSQEDIANEAGVSTPTVKAVFKKLLAKGLLKMIKHSVYMITPSMIRNGSNQKGMMLFRLWDES